MKKIFKLLFFLVLLFAVFKATGLLEDWKTLKQDLVRLHVVANSDSEHDQQIKLRVKDAISDYLSPIMEQFPSKEEAMEYIRENLSAIQDVANKILRENGVSDQAEVTLQPESFTTRVYDTFALPAGIYDALRVEIGAGDGQNWWCVVFPSLCLPASAEGFEDTAVASGFSQTLTNTLTRSTGYRLRFFVLDCFGRIENLFH